MKAGRRSPRDYAHSIDRIKCEAMMRVDSLVGKLAIRPRRNGHEWVSFSPVYGKQKTGSVSLNTKTGIFADFANIDDKSGKGDIIAYVAYHATDGDQAKAVLWLKDELGLTGKAPDPAVAAAAKERAEKSNKEAAEAVERRRKYAQRLWIDASPLSGNDPASLYLAGRRIDVTDLAEGLPRSIKFHPAVKASDGSGPYPTLIGCVACEGVAHGIAGIHRIYLRQENGVWIKARPKGKDKEALGPIKGGSVRVQRGASRKPAAEMPVGEWIAWTEGIEDAYALALAEPTRRIWAGPTLANLGPMVVPKQCGGLLVVRDNDPPGSAADNQVMRACYKLRERGIRVKIARMPAGFKDVNDVLIGKKGAA